MKDERIEMLRIGKICADRWWHHNKSTILSNQVIESQKEKRGIA